ncbi:MAG: GTPase domain-containing protein [Leptolyngbyaceae cyanobacterium CRU_2_3]|nr:GTPase domain-containing protein [Leptolyngbyaceae cyanobacterium CRU_2_3]
MVSLLQRPILIGGLALTAGAGLLSSLDPGIAHFGSTAVGGAIALGTGFWWLKLKSKPAVQPLLPFTPVDSAAVEKAIADVESQINHLTAELEADLPATDTPVFHLRQRLATLVAELKRQEVRLAIMGGRSVGKTSLAQLLQSQVTDGNLSDNLGSNLGLSIQKPDLAPAQTGSDRTISIPTSITAEVENADLVLFLTAGDLTDVDFQILKQLIAKNHRILLLFNKQDQFLPDDRPVILQQMRDRMALLLATEDVIAVTVQPALMKVRQHQPDGTFVEQLKQPTPNIGRLQQRMQHLLTHESQQIIFATLKRQAQP